MSGTSLFGRLTSPLRAHSAGPSYGPATATHGDAHDANDPNATQPTMQSPFRRVNPSPMTEPPARHGSGAPDTMGQFMAGMPMTREATPVGVRDSPRRSPSPGGGTVRRGRESAMSPARHRASSPYPAATQRPGAAPALVTAHGGDDPAEIPGLGTRMLGQEARMREAFRASEDRATALEVLVRGLADRVVAAENAVRGQYGVTQSFDQRISQMEGEMRSALTAHPIPQQPPGFGSFPQPVNLSLIHI